MARDFRVKAPSRLLTWRKPQKSRQPSKSPRQKTFPQNLKNSKHRHTQVPPSRNGASHVSASSTFLMVSTTSIGGSLECEFRDNSKFSPSRSPSKHELIFYSRCTRHHSSSSRSRRLHRHRSIHRNPRGEAAQISIKLSDPTTAQHTPRFASIYDTRASQSCETELLGCV